MEFFGFGDYFFGFVVVEEGGGCGDVEVDEFVIDDVDVKIFDEFVEFFEEFGGFIGLYVVGLDVEEEGVFVVFGVVGGRS